MGHRVAIRQANIFAVRSCREVIDEIAGTSAVYRGRVIERAFRDMSTAANHNLPLESSYEAVGAYMLTKNTSDGPVAVGVPFDAARTEGRGVAGVADALAAVTSSRPPSLTHRLAW